MNLSSNNKIVVRYSGTSYNNFLKCSYTNENNIAFFDKTLEPRHQYKDLFHTDNIREALTHAMICSKKDLPAILMGYFEKNQNFSEILFGPFRVDGLYLFNNNIIDVENFNPFKTKNIESVLINTDYIHLLEMKKKNDKQYIS